MEKEEEAVTVRPSQLTNQPIIGIAVHACGPAGGGAELVVVALTLVGVMIFLASLQIQSEILRD
jgi:hypothetical protein